MSTNETLDFQKNNLARRKFAEHGITSYSGVWLLPQYKKAALAILNSGILSKGELIGPKSQRYSVADSQGKPDQDHLLFDLVQTFLDYDPISSHREILSIFDQYYWWMAEIAQLGGIQQKRLEKLHGEFRDKISKRVIEGKISPHWQQIIWTGEPPLSLSRAFAKIFVDYVPKAHSTHIVAWTNSVLKALGKEPDESDNTLRLYVGKIKKKRPQGPISITQ